MDWRRRHEEWVRRLSGGDGKRVLEALTAGMVLFSAAAVAAGQFAVAGFFLAAGAAGWLYGRCRRRERGICAAARRLTDWLF